MNQDVLPLTPATQGPDSGTVDPPLTLDAYWLTPYGSPGPGSTNTTYIIGHSWEDRGSAFNNLSTRANPGDRLTVTTTAGTINYTVTAVTTENKDTLKDSSIWAKVPNRLILISCYTADLWGKNVIISADQTITTDAGATRHPD
ncbi:MAG: class F sortase [Actinomycetota bacterium]|nr:class F sortase [Actinomycetota bacterium]